LKWAEKSLRSFVIILYPTDDNDERNLCGLVASNTATKLSSLFSRPLVKPLSRYDGKEAVVAIRH
jgi:hypothetical protein